MNENQEPKKDQIGEALRRVDATEQATEPEKVDVESLPTEGTQFGQAPTGAGSAFSMMQNMQNRLGDEYKENPEIAVLKKRASRMKPGEVLHINGETIIAPEQRQKTSEPPSAPITEEEINKALAGSEKFTQEQWDNLVPMTSVDFAGGTSTNNIPTFPSVSNTTNPPVTSPSTPESAEDQNLTRLIEFVNGTTFSADWVRQHLNEMERTSAFLPLSTQWKIPFGADVAKAVYDTIRSEGYVGRRFASLEIVMTSSINNVEWCASVLCLFALIDVLEICGTVRERMKG